MTLTIVLPTRHLHRAASWVCRSLIWVLIVVGVLAPAASISDCFGRWASTEGATTIDVAPCGAEICGVIVAFDPGEYPIFDEHNPETKLRERPMCGLRVLGGQLDATGRWVDGWAYDASDGTRYRVSDIRQYGGRTLELTVHVGFFKHSVNFVRVSGIPILCKAAAPIIRD